MESDDNESTYDYQSPDEVLSDEYVASQEEVVSDESLDEFASQEALIPAGDLCCKNSKSLRLTERDKDPSRPGAYFCIVFHIVRHVRRGSRRAN